MSGCLISDGKLFQSRGAATANVLSPKELCVRPTTSVRVSAPSYLSVLSVGMLVFNCDESLEKNLSPGMDFLHIKKVKFGSLAIFKL